MVCMCCGIWISVFDRLTDHMQSDLRTNLDEEYRHLWKVSRIRRFIKRGAVMGKRSGRHLGDPISAREKCRSAEVAWREDTSMIVDGC